MATSAHWMSMAKLARFNNTMFENFPLRLSSTCTGISLKKNPEQISSNISEGAQSGSLICFPSISPAESHLFMVVTRLVVTQPANQDWGVCPEMASTNFGPVWGQCGESHPQPNTGKSEMVLPQLHLISKDLGTYSHLTRTD